TTDSHLTWTSSDAAIATVDAAGLVKGITQGTVTITAEGINNDGSRVSDTATITVTDAIATALTVTPKTKTLAKGLTQSYKAEALMSTGQVIDVTANAQLTWSSSNTTIATISNSAGSQGVAQSLEKGTTTIKAEVTVNDVTLSDAATLTVGDAVVANIVVTPVNTSVPVGLEKAFTADAVMTDGTTQNVTEEATWTTADPGTALVSDTAGTKGIAEGHAVSATPVEITAAITIDGTDFSASGHLTVTDAVVTGFAIEPKTASVPKGLVQNFLAKATLSDGNIVDVTEHANVSWISSDTAIASISNSTGTKGQSTGGAVGIATITATATVAGNTWQDTATLNVTNAIVSSIQVTPANDTTPVGLTKPFTATATFSDDSTRDITADSTLSWSTDNSDIATISNTAGNEGVAKGEAIGSVTITATDTSGPSTVQGTATLDVTEAVITALQVTPTTETTPVGLAKAFTAVAVLSDSLTIDVTNDPAISWTSDNPSIATITSGQATGNGIATGEAIGEVRIKATGLVQGKTFEDSATLTVTDAVVTALEVTPTTDITSVGLSKAFTAVAVLSDSRTVDVTNDPAVSWSSSDGGIASVITGQLSGNGVAKGESPGLVTITASGMVNGIEFSDNATLEVIKTDIRVAGRLEYAQQLSVQLIGLKKEDVTITWNMDLTNFDGANDDLQEIPSEQGGVGNSLNYTIGTYQYSIDNLGLKDLNENGVIDEKDWISSDIRELGVLPAQYFIGKDVQVCIRANSNSEAEDLIGTDATCLWASDFTSKDGSRCEDPSSCVAGGIIANDKGDVRVEPIRVIELPGGYGRQRALSFYEIPEDLRSKVKKASFNGIDWLTVPVGGSVDLGLSNDDGKQVAVDICQLRGGFLPIAKTGFDDDLIAFGNKAALDITLTQALSTSYVGGLTPDSPDFPYNGPISGQFANDYISASVQKSDNVHPGVTFDVWVSTGDVVEVGPGTTSVVTCLSKL
ncbi:hypothetical protein CGI59_24190, partial [Vibrio parahaemolyticus]